MTFDIQAQVKRVYELNEKWWTDIHTGLPIERNEGEFFMLMTSELAEAMEGERKNLDDDKLPQFKMAGVEMVDFVIRIMDYCGRRGIELTDNRDLVITRLPWVMPSDNRSELIWGMVRRLASLWSFETTDKIRAFVFSGLIADARIYCEKFGYPFEEAFEAKYQYNVTRDDHKHESRLKDDGKKF